MKKIQILIHNVAATASSRYTYIYEDTYIITLISGDKLIYPEHFIQSVSHNKISVTRNRASSILIMGCLSNIFFLVITRRSMYNESRRLPAAVSWGNHLNCIPRAPISSQL